MRRALPACAALALAAAALADNEALGPKFQTLPADNPWHWDVSRHKVHPDSAKIIASMGADTDLHPDFGKTYGIPYAVVSAKTKKQKILEWEYGDESDREPYPIPDNPPIEGGPDADGDRHILMVDRDAGMLYELYHVFPVEKKGWKAGSGAIFNLRSNDLRPENWTSADAAGLPIFAGLVRFEEVERGLVDHAVRFTARRSRSEHWWPARHHAGRGADPALPPMGLRVRLKAGFEVKGYSKRNRVILEALKRHGMILADNGSDWYMTGAPDPRWDDDDLSELKKVKGGDFEVIRSVDEKGKPIYPPRK